MRSSRRGLIVTSSVRSPSRASACQASAEIGPRLRSTWTGPLNRKRCSPACAPTAVPTSTRPSRERTRDVAPSTQKSAPDAKPQFHASAWLEPQVCCWPPGTPFIRRVSPLTSIVPDTLSAGCAPTLATEDSPCHLGRRNGNGGSRDCHERSQRIEPRSVCTCPEHPSRSSLAPSILTPNGRKDVCSARSGKVIFPPQFACGCSRSKAKAQSADSDFVDTPDAGLSVV